MEEKKKEGRKSGSPFSLKRWMAILALALIGIFSWYQARVQWEAVQLKSIAKELNEALDPSDPRWRNVDDIWAAVLLAEARQRDHGRFASVVVMQNILEASTDRPRILLDSRTKQFYVAWGGFRGLRLG